jgi:ATP-dependent Lon protease
MKIKIVIYYTDHMPQNKIIKKKTKIKNSTYKNVSQKISYYKSIVQNTILSIQRYKSLDIVSASDLNICINKLQEIYLVLTNIEKSFTPKSKNVNNIVQRLQEINNEITVVFQKYGTNSIESVLAIVFGQQYLKQNLLNGEKMSVINKHLHPISYKILNWCSTDVKETNKRLARNKIVEDFMIVETANTLDCFDLSRTSNIFQLKVSGIKICFQNPILKKTLIIQCIADDVLISCSDNSYIVNYLKELYAYKINDFDKDEYHNFISALSLKEILIYNNQELFHKFVGFCNQNKVIKQKTIQDIIKDFLSSDLYKQRNTLTQILLKNNDPEFQYLSYLLYDLLSNENNGAIDTQEQTLLFDSFPWSIKKFFKSAMKKTINYTKEISNFETSKIPLEQQICLLKASNTVKEKAMIKLKEIKAKTEDSGSKARAYLEGLLKIPFGIFKTEQILNVMEDINIIFKKLIEKIKEHDHNFSVPILEKYNNNDIIKYTKFITETYIKTLTNNNVKLLIDNYINNKREILVYNICYINNILKKHNIKKYHICHSGKKTNYMKQQIKNTINDFSNNSIILNEIENKYKNDKNITLNSVNADISNINNKWDVVKNGMDNIHNTLEDSVHGHRNAKRQIERIIGQWVTGEQTGYCFGFEGPPGVGKTSLARKGLAYCLKDKKGNPRPFSFIAVGGASNGSTIAGHNYTYVGSTWGKIVDVLVDSSCMNPIIFIDELDKISKTENGKEIIGILTHLIDTTQNDQFQDKYFSGIDLDLSKALFIFSYNDVNAIDRILLDRIHRIKFKHLTLQDKLTICHKYILPEYYEKFNIADLKFSDEVLSFIIQHYTNESGVRKLKEIIFEILSEINLQMLQDHNKPIDIEINIDSIKKNYLKNKSVIKEKNIHKTPQVGIINGLWANSLGMGGIIPIESSFMPSNTFLELNLTGLQGDVMKESMNVAKTLAWKLTPNNIKTKLISKFKRTKMQCIHIHCPEGAVPKDGPSAGTAITVCIFSLFNDKKIKNDIAITGEINLQGQVTPIGGLDLKVLGGIRAGVKTFIYPKDNQDDFDKIMNDTNDHSIFENIHFISVKHIREVLDIVFIN